MKWIGQNIYDLVSRFRNDVYLEDISSGTIASGAHLGLDSNNKIVKATDGGGDLTSIVAGTGLSGTDLTGPIPTLNVDASQTQITGVGTITTGVWNGTAIASAYLDSDTAHLSGAQTFTGAKTFNEITSAIFDGDKSVTPGDGAVIHVDGHDVTDNNTSASGTAAKYTHINIEAPRLFATNASVTTTAAASLYINAAPTARTNQTITNAYALWVDDGLVKFDGALTVGGTITGDVTGNLTGQADTVQTIASLAPNTATTQATQPNITTLAGVTAIGTAANTLIFTNDIVRFDSANANDPLVLIKNAANDATSGRLRFLNERGADGQDDDETGIIEFFSYDDGTPAGERYARIIGTIHDATAGQESGKLSLQVASHDGGDEDGLVLTGGSADAEVDVTIGNGAASVVTIPGGLSLGTDLPTDQQKHLMHYRFLGYGTGDGTNYFLAQPFTDAQAPFEHADSSSADGTTIPAGGGTNISELIRSGGYVMPNAVTLKKWTGWGTYNGSDDAYVAIYKWTPVDNDNTDITPVLLDIATIDGAGNDKARSFAETSFTQASVAAGDIIFTQIRTDTNNKTVYFNSTLEVEF